MRSRFGSASERNGAVRVLMFERLEQLCALEGALPAEPAQTDAAAQVLQAVKGSAAGREAVFALAAYALVEKRPLNLVDPDAGDLASKVDGDGSASSTKRLAGDRACTDALSKQLHQLHIPATKGALQSSTYRGGYMAAQAREPGLASYVQWASDTTLPVDAIGDLFEAVAIHLASLQNRIAELPDLNRRLLTHRAVDELTRRLFVMPSQGAFEQYWLAALLQQSEDQMSDGRRRAHTKALFGADASAKTAGDIEIRHGQNLVSAYEVTANEWRTKMEQVISVLRAHPELDGRLNLAAGSRPVSADEAQRAIAAVAPPGIRPDSLDIAINTVDAWCSIVSASLTARQREAAVMGLHQHLATFCAARPELVDHLIEALEDLGLTDAEPEG